MKSADITIGESYVYMSWGRYAPSADPYARPQGGEIKKVKILATPGRGRVLVEFPNGDHDLVATRELHVKWSEHVATMAQQRTVYQAQLDLAAKERAERRATTIAVFDLLEVVGEEWGELELRPRYGFDPIVIAQELADMGIHVQIGNGWRFEDEAEHILNDLSEYAGHGVLVVFSPGNIAAYYAGIADKLYIEPANLLALGALV